MNELAIPTPTALPVEPVVLITGAARGVGAACARRFAADGAAVILADLRIAEAEQVAQSLRAGGAQAVALSVDLASPEAVADLAVHARAAFGHVDILINNAGMILPKGFVEASVEEWDQLQAVNVRAIFLLCRALLPDLQQQRGCIVNVASTAGLRPQFENGPYCAAKSTVIMLTQSLAQEVLRDGVRVNCVCPGAIDTPLLEEYARARGDECAVVKMRENGMILPPEDVADAIAFLASRQARSITGHALVVDRGALLM